MLQTILEHVIQVLPQSLLLKLCFQQVYPPGEVLILLDILNEFLQACKLCEVVLALRLVSLRLVVQLMKVVLD